MLASLSFTAAAHSAQHIERMASHARPEGIPEELFLEARELTLRLESTHKNVAA